MVGYIFKNVGPQKDELSVAEGADYLAFRIGFADDDLRQRATVERSDVLRLYNVLGAWLWPGETNNATPADPEPIYTALIRRLVTEEVARVLPLHQAPQAAVAEPRFICRTPGTCVAIACSDCRVVVPSEPDPEPHDVGHVDEPADHGRLMSELQRAAVRPSKCDTCKHFWSDHTGQMCWGHSKCGCAQERS